MAIQPPPSFIIPPSPLDANHVTAISAALRSIKNALVASDLDNYNDEVASQVSDVDVTTMLPGIRVWENTTTHYLQGQLVIHDSFLWIRLTDGSGAAPGSNLAWKKVNEIPSMSSIWTISTQGLFNLAVTWGGVGGTTATCNLSAPPNNLPSGVKAILLLVSFANGQHAGGSTTFSFNTINGMIPSNVGVDLLGPFIFPVTGNSFSISNLTQARSQLYLLGYAL